MTVDVDAEQAAFLRLQRKLESAKRRAGRLDLELRKKPTPAHPDLKLLQILVERLVSDDSALCKAIADVVEARGVLPDGMSCWIPIKR